MGEPILKSWQRVASTEVKSLTVVNLISIKYLKFSVLSVE